MKAVLGRLLVGLSLFVVGVMVLLGGALLEGWALARIPDCHELPSTETVDRVMAEHGDEITSLATGPGTIWIVKDDIEGCPGKSMIEIMYGTVYERDRIRKKLGKTGFGIPYRMSNI